eukprot:376654-Pelagomonas_calceolata.AAC.1
MESFDVDSAFPDGASPASSSTSCCLLEREGASIPLKSRDVQAHVYADARFSAVEERLQFTPDKDAQVTFKFPLPHRAMVHRSWKDRLPLLFSNGDVHTPPTQLACICCLACLHSRSPPPSPLLTHGSFCLAPKRGGSNRSSLWKWLILGGRKLREAGCQ